MCGDGGMAPLGRSPWKRHYGKLVVGDHIEEEGGSGHIKRHVLPHAPSPTMTSFLRIDSVMAIERVLKDADEVQKTRSRQSAARSR